MDRGVDGRERGDRRRGPRWAGPVHRRERKSGGERENPGGDYDRCGHVSAAGIAVEYCIETTLQGSAACHTNRRGRGRQVPIEKELCVGGRLDTGRKDAVVAGDFL